MNRSSRLLLETEDRMLRFGRCLGMKLPDGAVIGLSGPLGAGKTTLARGIAEGLGVDENYIVSSPTYTMIQSYPCSERYLHHLDLYRIKGPDDLDSTGYRDLVDEESVLVVEWPEREPSVLPEENLTVVIEYCDEGREVTLIPTGGRYMELAEKIIGEFHGNEQSVISHR